MHVCMAYKSILASFDDEYIYISDSMPTYVSRVYVHCSNPS